VMMMMITMKAMMIIVMNSAQPSAHLSRPANIAQRFSRFME